jgi:hypothetical protein
MSTPTLTSADYRFEGGFPTPETVQWAYDDADLVRAITAYRFFFPSVSALSIYKGEFDYSPVPFETELGYWEHLHELIDTEPPYDGYRNEYCEDAALGIANSSR